MLPRPGCANELLQSVLAWVPPPAARIQSDNYGQDSGRALPGTLFPRTIPHYGRGHHQLRHRPRPISSASNPRSSATPLIRSTPPLQWETSAPPGDAPPFLHRPQVRVNCGGRVVAAYELFSYPLNENRHRDFLSLGQHYISGNREKVGRPRQRPSSSRLMGNWAIRSDQLSPMVRMTVVRIRNGKSRYRNVGFFERISPNRKLKPADQVP
jgi:hypothetical protein